MNNDFEFDALIKKMAADHQPELPISGVIWWRAQILKKHAEKERIERPFIVMRFVAAVASVLVLVGLWVSQADGIRSTLSRVGGFPLVSFMIVGTVIGIGFIGLMWWSTTRTRSQS
jgi:hypothetical protein